MPLETMTDKVLSRGDKRLSQHSKSLLDQLGKIASKASSIVPELYASLRDDGFEPFEARVMIEQRVDISQRQLLKLIPHEAKQTIMIREKKLLPKRQQLTSDIVMPSQKYTPLPPPPPASSTYGRDLITVTLDLKEFEMDIRGALANLVRSNIHTMELSVDMASREVVGISS